MSPNPCLPLLTSAALLAGCQDSGGAVTPKHPIADIDPAVTTALHDQILIDPALTQHSNMNAIRPPEMPLQAMYPLATDIDQPAGCGDVPFDRGLAWARRLPAEFAIPAGARVVEAAATSEPGCNLRVVTFRVADAPQRALDLYRTRTAAAGYINRQGRRDGDYLLSGSHPQHGMSFHLIVMPRSAGSEIALVVHDSA